MSRMSLSNIVQRVSSPFFKACIALVTVLALALGLAPINLAHADPYIPQPADGASNASMYSHEELPASNDTEIATVQEERDPAVSAAASLAQTTDKSVRSEKGIVSQLATDKHNPYNGQIRLNIDVGSEFATFAGSDTTEGIIMKVTPGGEVELPVVKARDGYYFIGWCQGGVPEEPTWDLFTKSVEVTDDTSEGKDMSLYAIFADESGDGFCTCGAWTSGIYADQMEQIKADAQLYEQENGIQSSVPSFLSWFSANPTISIIVGVALYLILLLIIAKVMSKAAEKDDE